LSWDESFAGGDGARLAKLRSDWCARDGVDKSEIAELIEGIEQRDVK
jgi:hypothetical protein